MKDIALRYFLEEDSNCAEAVFKAACDQFNIDASDEAMHAVGAFGGGMGCGEVCGALCGAVSAIGLALIKERAHVTPALKPATTQMRDGFLHEFKSLDCNILKPVFFKEGVKCSAVVSKACDVLEVILSRELKEE